MLLLYEVHRSSYVNMWCFTLVAISITFLCNCDQTMYTRYIGQAAERPTVRDTPAGRRPFATDAEATSSADMDVPFATGDVPGTDATTTVIAIVVSAGATAAAASDKHIAKGNVRHSLS